MVLFSRLFEIFQFNSNKWSFDTRILIFPSYIWINFISKSWSRIEEYHSFQFKNNILFNDIPTIFVFDSEIVEKQHSAQATQTILILTQFHFSLPICCSEWNIRRHLIGSATFPLISEVTAITKGIFNKILKRWNHANRK